MKTNVERIKPTRVKLTITATPADLRPSIDHAYEHIAEDVSIPGFRKGKVPPAILEKRVGKPAILAHAINDGLDRIYREAVEANDVRVIGQPQADIKSTPDENTFEGDLVVEIEVEVRPEIKLGNYKGLKVKVDDIAVKADEIDAELENLRKRFGALKTVERPAKKGDFTSIDLKAVIGDMIIDEASNISYEIGSGNLLDGIDDALDTLTAGETTTFKSKLVGGDKAGEEAEITVTLTAVKERELPNADDEFAKLASEFDTIAELKKSIEEQIKDNKTFGQGIAAREKLTETLLEQIDVAVSEETVNQDVNRHLEGEGRLEDDKHRAEVLEESTKSFKTQMILDEIARAEDIKVNENELIQYLIQLSQSYGMNPNEFIQMIDQNGQVPAFVQEVARRKALTVVLEHAEVSDSKGKIDVKALIAAPEDFAGESHEGHDH
jgi:trigger factor